MVKYAQGCHANGIGAFNHELDQSQAPTLHLRFELQCLLISVT